MIHYEISFTTNSYWALTCSMEPTLGLEDENNRRVWWEMIIMLCTCVC